MNKTGFKATVIVCGAILAILGAALTFMLCNIVPTAWMERVEINGRVIPVTGAELNYEADTPVWKGGDNLYIERIEGIVQRKRIPHAVLQRGD